MGSSFMKLMFTVWISIHLFALAVFHRNLQRLERLYVVSSLHCATAFSMQSCAESAYQPYADEYH